MRYPLTQKEGAVCYLSHNDEALKAHAGEGPLFVLFTGEYTDGKSWCPDCNDAGPVIEAALAEAAKTDVITLLECHLPRKEYSGNPDHWARKHPQAKLQRIPTLMKWGVKAKTGELIEGACKDAKLVRELMEH